jgi:hypothetical protein
VREELAFYAEPGLMTTIGGLEIALGAAALTVSDDHHEIRHRYETDAAVHVPSRVTSFYASRPTEVDVPELMIG